MNPLEYARTFPGSFGFMVVGCLFIYSCAYIMFRENFRKVTNKEVKTN